MKKNFIFSLHSIAGLVSAIFILLMSLSGAALVFHDELDAGIPRVVAGDSNMISVDRCYATIKEQYPSAQVSNCVLPIQKGNPFSFFLYDPSFKDGKSSMEVFLHPQTAALLKTRGGAADFQHNFMGWLSKVHNSLHLGKTGEWLLGSFALVFLLSIITGFILFRYKIIAVLLFRRPVYNRYNLHQVIGVWALLFNLMIAVTGFWMQRYVFKKDFYAANNYTPVYRSSPPLSFSFDTAYLHIQKQYPGFTAAVIYFAQSNKGNTAVYGSRTSNAYIHSKKFADVIFLDSTGGVASTRFINEIDPADRYDIINSQLHMGRFGGMGIKIIYFVFGLSGALLSITGFLLWRKKKIGTTKVQLK